MGLSAFSKRPTKRHQGDAWGFILSEKFGSGLILRVSHKKKHPKSKFCGSGVPQKKTPKSFRSVFDLGCFFTGQGKSNDFSPIALAKNPTKKTPRQLGGFFNGSNLVLGVFCVGHPLLVAKFLQTDQNSSGHYLRVMIQKMQ